MSRFKLKEASELFVRKSLVNSVITKKSPTCLVHASFLRAITECTNGAMCDVRVSFRPDEFQEERNA